MNGSHESWNPLRILSEIAGCLVSLTRLNITISGADPDAPRGRGAWALPFAGAFMGAIAGAAYALASGFGFDPVLAAAIAVAVGTAVTGARGEWGLASACETARGEAADGGRLGATGATVLVLAVVLKIAAIASLDDAEDVMAALMAAGALAATASAGMLYYMPDEAGGPPVLNVAVGFLIALIIALIVVEFGAFAAAILVVLAAFVFAGIHKRWAGETTPASLGAVVLVCEIAALLAIVASD